MEQQREEGNLVPRGEFSQQLAPVPDETHFQGILAAATGAQELGDLRRLVHAWQAVAEQCDAATTQVMRLAVFRLEVERELGAAIVQTVRRGGRGSKSHAATSIKGGASRGLPDGVTKHQSRRYKALAAIPDEVFSDYIAKVKKGKKPPTSAGAHRFAGSLAGKPPVRPQAASASRPESALELPAHVLHAISKVMTPDVVIGDSGMPGKLRRMSFAALRTDLAGEVFVAHCPDPAAWLADLHRLRSARTISQVVVALEAEVWADWFKMLEVDGWTCCFLAGVRSASGNGVLLAYDGVDQAAFGAEVSRVGTVCR